MCHHGLVVCERILRVRKLTLRFSQRHGRIAHAALHLFDTICQRRDHLVFSIPLLLVPCANKFTIFEKKTSKCCQIQNKYKRIARNLMWFDFFWFDEILNIYVENKIGWEANKKFWFIFWWHADMHNFGSMEDKTTTTTTTTQTFSNDNLVPTLQKI